MDDDFALADRTRADLADLIDRQMRPLGEAVLRKLSLASGDTVMDIGCGAGETTLQLAELVGSAGRVIGVDIAPRVLELARRRAMGVRNVEFVQEDAGSLLWPDGSLDAIFSRFGTMFFADPVAAFRNLKRMLRPGGQVGFVCWRSVEENELDALCLKAAGVPITVDGAPYSFEKAAVIEEVLSASGFRAIAIAAHDTQVSAGDVAASFQVMTRVGALGRILRRNPALLPQVKSRVIAALASRDRGGLVELGAATWVVTGTA